MGSAQSRAVCEDVAQAHELPIGPAVQSWFERQAWLRMSGRQGLLDSRLRAAPDLVRSSLSLIAPPEGWRQATLALRQSHGMRWELEVDEAVAGLVAGCTGDTPLTVLLQLLASAVESPVDQIIEALLPVVRDLVECGFLVPEAVG